MNSLSPTGDGSAGPTRLFLGLDGFRGIAAFAVMWTHELGIFRPGGTSIYGAIAVDMFFMLSGFVIAYAYQAKLDQGLTWSKFMRARFIRLYPMLLAGVIAGVAVSLLKQSYQGISIPSESWFLVVPVLMMLPIGLLYTKPELQTGLFPFDGPMWSLFFEFVASALFATKLRNLRGVALYLFLSGTTLALMSATVWAGTMTRLGLLDGYVGFAGGFARVAVPFAIGVIICNTSLHNKVPDLRFFCLATILAALLFAPVTARWQLDFVFVFMIFPVLICLGARCSLSPVESVVCSFIGRLSYPLYLLHVPVSRAVGYAAKTVFPSLGGYDLIWISVFGTILASWLALVLYDEPVRTWLTELTRASQKRAYAT